MLNVTKHQALFRLTAGPRLTRGHAGSQQSPREPSQATTVLYAVVAGVAE